MAEERNVESRADEVVRRNVRTIAELERAKREERTRAEHVVGAITAFCGSTSFVVIQTAVYGVWIAVNVGPFEPLRFDPYPFGLLTMLVSLEALFLATFILITQRRESRAADRRHHLDLQISMLAEQEITKVLETTERIADRLGVAHADPETEALKQVTAPEKVVDHIERYVEEPERSSP